MKSKIQHSRCFHIRFGIICSWILIFFDQITKYLAVKYLKDSASKILIPDVLEFTYLENRGIAFGLMQGQRMLFLIICIAFLCFVCYVFKNIPKTKYYWPLIFTVFLITSGALGNFIDRVFRGYVVDFIYIVLINFPIFNIADIYVVCGGIILIILVMFKYKDEDFEFLKVKKRG